MHTSTAIGIGEKNCSRPWRRSFACRSDWWAKANMKSNAYSAFPMCATYAHGEASTKVNAVVLNYVFH